MSKNEKTALAVGSIGAGFLSGLLGAGGGIILYFLLGRLFKDQTKENLVISSVSVMFFCLISLFFYSGNAEIALPQILNLFFPAALGGLLGALLLSKIPKRAVRKLFSVIVILSGILMLMR